MKFTDLSILSNLDVGVIWCHPNNLEYLQNNLPKPNPYIHLPLDGIRIRTNEYLEEYKLVWEPPNEKFIQYEQKDESWARPLGIGKLVKQPIFHLMNTQTFNVGTALKFS